MNIGCESSLKDIKSNNSNFAFISKVSLTEPVTNTRLYGESIAKIANVLGDSKPIIQTLKDLRSGRRSEWHRINKGFVEPTLKDCVAGDLALVLPHRIITNILEGLEKLDKIIPGVNNDETLLYGPERPHSFRLLGPCLPSGRKSDRLLRSSHASGRRQLC